MEVVWFLLLGAAMGTLSGLLGIGGGVVVVPCMVMFLGADIKKAIAISLATIVPVAISGLLKHLSTPEIKISDLAPGLIIGITGIIFALFGAWLNQILPAAVLKKFFAIFMVFVGLKMFFDKPKDTSKAKATPEQTQELQQDKADDAPAESAVTAE